MGLGEWELLAALESGKDGLCSGPQSLPAAQWACEGSWADAEHSPDAALGESSLTLQLLAKQSYLAPDGCFRAKAPGTTLGFRDHCPQGKPFCRAQRDMLKGMELCAAGMGWVRPQEQARMPFPAVAGPCGKLPTLSPA